jgi:hypothetical protein
VNIVDETAVFGLGQIQVEIVELDMDLVTNAAFKHYAILGLIDDIHLFHRVKMKV